MRETWIKKTRKCTAVIVVAQRVRMRVLVAEIETKAGTGPEIETKIEGETETMTVMTTIGIHHGHGSQESKVGESVTNEVIGIENMAVTVTVTVTVIVATGASHQEHPPDIQEGHGHLHRQVYETVNITMMHSLYAYNVTVG